MSNYGRVAISYSPKSAYFLVKKCVKSISMNINWAKYKLLNSREQDAVELYHN